MVNTIKTAGLVIFVEIMIDWTKHCFVTKFNNLSHETYPRFLAYLRYDALCNSPYANWHCPTDKFISQTKRMGFIPLPLACVVSSFHLFLGDYLIQIDCPVTVPDDAFGGYFLGHCSFGRIHDARGSDQVTSPLRPSALLHVPANKDSRRGTKSIILLQNALTLMVWLRSRTIQGRSWRTPCDLNSQRCQVGSLKLEELRKSYSS